MAGPSGRGDLDQGAAAAVAAGAGRLQRPGGPAGPVAGSGDVPVLATPRLLALAEAATVAAIAPHLAPGMTSVGTSASLEHRRASPVGTKLVVEAELTEVDGRRLVFSFIAREGGRRP